MKQTWVQKGSDAAKYIKSEWGMYLKSIPFKAFPDVKDVFSREWVEESGEEEYLPPTPVFKSYEMDVQFVYLGALDTAGDKIFKFCEYIAGGEISLYDEFTGVGCRCRFVSYDEKAFYRRDEDTVQFSIKFKVNNPLCYAVKSVGTSDIRFAVAVKTAVYWSDGTATLHDANSTVSKVMDGFGVVAPYSSSIAPSSVVLNPMPSKDGYTFTPSISEDGTLSYSNNGGLPNPTPIKIIPSNKSILDGIIQSVVNAWNGAVSWIANTGSVHVADSSIHLSTEDRANISSIVGKENAGVAAQLISDLKSGVSTEGDTLKKLYDLIVSAYSEVTVADISARNAYNVKKLPTSIFVLDDGDGRWALYKATTTGTNASYVKISDPDLLNSVMTASQIKTAYESVANAFTDAEKQKLAQQSGINTGDQDLSGLEPKKGADDFYVTNAEKTQGALATGNTTLDTVKKVADKAQFAPNENGTILYHTIKRFLPTGTISTNGITASITSNQFTSNMVGDKLVINGEERIIITYINQTQVYVSNEYSQNYTNIISENWKVCARLLFVMSGGINYGICIQDSSGNKRIISGVNGEFSIDQITDQLYKYVVSGGSFSCNNLYRFLWSNDQYSYSTKDLGVRRNSTGILEIYDGITNGTYRDLNLRNLNYYGTLNNASDERLKHDIRPVNDGLEKVCKLAECVKHFEFNNQDIYAKGQRTGFVAQLLKANGFEGHVSEREPANEEEGAIFGWTYKNEQYEEVNPETQEVEVKTRRVVDVKGDMVLQVENNFSPYLYPAIAELKRQNYELEKRLALLEQKLA